MARFSILYLFQRELAVDIVVTMQHLRDGDIFEIGITMLKFIGENMEQTSLKLQFYRVVNCAIQVLITIFICANLLHVEGGLYVNTLEHLVTVLHVNPILHD